MIFGGLGQQRSVAPVGGGDRGRQGQCLAISGGGWGLLGAVGEDNEDGGGGGDDYGLV